MQIERTENELIIRESPGCLWIFGLFFALVGGLFVYGALGGLSDYNRQSPLTLAAAFLMGSIGVAAGVWIIYRAPITRLVIDRRDERITLTRYGLYGRQQIVYLFDEIEDFRLIEERDHDGDPVWSLGMRLASGETIVISALASHDERFKRDFVYQANEFMGRQMLSTQYVLGLEDETDDEMS